VISPTLFAMLVLMALVTTFATTPMLEWITRHHRFTDEGEGPVEAPAAAVDAVRPPGGGLLVPVSNPEGLGPMLELAVAATRQSDPPPRILALVRRPAGSIHIGLSEMEASPRAPILAEAAKRATAMGARVDTQAVWTDHPADDILACAADPHLGWLLLGFHRPVFGGDLLGGVVKEVLDRVDRRGVHVGVVVHGHERPLDRVVAVVDDSDDGHAALELAARVAATRRSSLHAVLVPREGHEPEPALQELLKVTARDAGRWLHTDVLTRRNPAELSYKTVGDLVMIGMGLADELGLPLDDPPGMERCVVLVRGAERARASGLEAPAKAS
jgi:hypothetical protein